MFESRNEHTFGNAPQSVTGLIATLLEPGVAVLVFVAIKLGAGDHIDRPDAALLMLTATLTFPGINRFRDRFSNAAVDITRSWLGTLLILALFGYATRSLSLFDLHHLLAWAGLTPLTQLLLVRLGHRVLQHHARLPQNRRGAIIIGAGHQGLRVAERIAAAASQGIDVLGFFDDRGDLRVPADAQERILGPLRAAAPFINANGVSHVFITLPLSSQPRILELMEDLQTTTASIYFVPDVFGVTIIQGRLLDMNGVPVVGICETPFTGINRLVKRISDIVLASLILLLISPLLLAVAIGVKLSSPGPVIFRQRRNGLGGEEIVVYKFRSMRVMENGARVTQATRGDPRITPFGAFIRKTSLDELPQFINVLQGRMSIVGPRPHAVAHNEQYRALIKAYMVRHKVKPGITGWAQVNGLRGETDTIDKMQARVEYDLAYLRNWSLTLDLQIILRTIRSVISDRSAY
ncbi:undecaprenyl-phosphate glucose phosphotransferase [Pseudaquabacterium rugosum]|uniref:Undecaprenyl-phosphate glucose phosphotransferase n=1 Tax=Pseudaquabacterium rugosum TaxID=2984194 RepID=A0ABU9B7K0_9BURK